MTKRTETHHPRRKGSDHGLLIESEIETGTGSPPHLKIESAIGHGIGGEEVAVLALGPAPSLQRGKVTLRVFPTRRGRTLMPPALVPGGPASTLSFLFPFPFGFLKCGVTMQSRWTKM